MFAGPQVTLEGTPGGSGASGSGLQIIIFLIKSIDSFFVNQSVNHSVQFSIIYKSAITTQYKMSLNNTETQSMTPKQRKS